MCLNVRCFRGLARILHLLQRSRVRVRKAKLVKVIVDASPKDAQQCSLVSSFFCRKPGLCPSAVSAFWRYRVSLQRKKCCQQIIGLDDESFSIAVCIDAKKKSVLGKMLRDAVRPALCAYRSVISQYFIAIPHLGQSWYATHGRCVPQSQPDRRSRAAPALAAQ